MSLRFYQAVIGRELQKMLRQKDRLASAMVRPVLWLWVIGGGMSSLAGPDYALRLMPGIVAMTLLFGGMIGGLSIALDKDAGTMRLLVAAPVSELHVLLAKGCAACLNACLQTLLFLLILLAVEGLNVALRWGFGQGASESFVAMFAWVGRFPAPHVAQLLGVMLLGGFTCAALGLLCGVFTKTIDGFAVMMNFVIFPVFFFSGALYPVSGMPSLVKFLALLNPFTYVVDAMRHVWGLNAEHSLGLNFSVMLLALGLMLAVAVWKFKRGGAVVIFRV
jgi:ABC-2 type transport system permease protein